MDLKRAIRDLLDDGYSEQGIADALNEQGVECTQATINRIKLGRIPDPRFSVGTGIVHLHQRRKQRGAGQRRSAS
jgi:arginine repressor